MVSLLRLRNKRFRVHIHRDREGSYVIATVDDIVKGVQEVLCFKKVVSLQVILHPVVVQAGQHGVVLLVSHNLLLQVVRGHGLSDEGGGSVELGHELTAVVVVVLIVV